MWYRVPNYLSAHIPKARRRCTVYKSRRLKSRNSSSWSQVARCNANNNNAFFLDWWIVKGKTDDVHHPRFNLIMLSMKTNTLPSKRRAEKVAMCLWGHQAGREHGLHLRVQWCNGELEAMLALILRGLELLETSQRVAMVIAGVKLSAGHTKSQRWMKTAVKKPPCRPKSSASIIRPFFTSNLVDISIETAPKLYLLSRCLTKLILGMIRHCSVVYISSESPSLERFSTARERYTVNHYCFRFSKTNSSLATRPFQFGWVRG